jgi:hypothetical protein
MLLTNTPNLRDHEMHFHGDRRFDRENDDDAHCRWSSSESSGDGGGDSESLESEVKDERVRKYEGLGWNDRPNRLGSTNSVARLNGGAQGIFIIK